jgi:hypothetical protein
MLKIVRSVVGDCVVFTVSGRFELVHVAELQAAMDREMQRIALDLEEVNLVDREVVPCLARWETEGVELQRCPAYIRNWITKAIRR